MCLHCALKLLNLDKTVIDFNYFQPRFHCRQCPLMSSASSLEIRDRMDMSLINTDLLVKITVMEPMKGIFEPAFSKTFLNSWVFNYSTPEECEDTNVG